MRLHQDEDDDVPDVRGTTLPPGPPPAGPSLLTVAPVPSQPRSEDRQGGSAKCFICVFRNLFRFYLNAFTDNASTLCWSNWFQLSITLSEKKYFLTSVLHLCLRSFIECPLVLMSVLLSKKLAGMTDCPRKILKTSIKSALFLLSND